MSLLDNVISVANNVSGLEKLGNITFGQIKDSFDKYIVRPANAFGLGGFVFDVEGDTSVNLAADITDHYTENNVAIQDHVALKPLRVTLNNYVGELVYRLDKTTNTSLQNLVRKLTTIDSFLPDLARGAAQAKAIFDTGFSNLKLDDIVNTGLRDAADLWGLVQNITPPTQRQSKAHLYFKALWQQKILVSVQTPFEFLPNMIIESVISRQPEENTWVSNFSITLKQMRFVETSTIPFNSADYDARAGLQSQPIADKGKVQGAAAPLESELYKLGHQVGVSISNAGGLGF